MTLNAWTQRAELKMVRASGVIDYDAHGANMYGCQPCPKCGEPYRCVFNNAPDVIDCECGHKEPVTARIQGDEVGK